MLYMTRISREIAEHADYGNDGLYAPLPVGPLSERCVVHPQRAYEPPGRAAAPSHKLS